MRQRHIFVLISISILLTNKPLLAQDTTVVQTVQDSLAERKSFLKRFIAYFEEANKDKSQRKFDISVIGGPSYSVDTKLGIGLIAAGLFRIDKADLSLAPSDVAIYGNFTTSGFLAVGVENTTIFPNDKYRLFADVGFRYMPSKFYGIGYLAGKEALYSDYNQYYLGLKLDFRRKVFSHTYVGLALSAQNNRAKGFEDPSLMPEVGNSSTAVGPGFIVSYDSRDFIPNARKGLFLQYEQLFFLKALGTDRYFSSINFSGRTYHSVWENGLIAFDLNAEFNYGDTPWTLLSRIGGSRQMRGYYIGQYRDRSQLNTQLELRQKVYRRHGMVAWVGAGNAFAKLPKFEWAHTLPTYGLGYRWEFKSRVNVRLDYGFGKGQSGFYFNIYEAF